METPSDNSKFLSTLETPFTLAVNGETHHESVDPATLSWHNLRYTVQPTTLLGKNGPPKTILKNIHGHVSPGQLTAIMGPSGSGKTTLLDILADRVSSGTIEGNIEVNGHTRHSSSFRKMATYVAQEDSLLGSFTVLETLRFAAKISLQDAHAVQEERVQAAISDMGLTSCANTRVGDLFFKGISGGQKRRLSIAIALLTNPSILLLDEPTSGLDSASTYHIMKYIAKLCAAGRTVVCTIHQPSAEVYNMFSTVSILVEGSTVFYGSPAAALTHFESLNYPCPLYTNPAEYFVSLVNTDFEGHADVPAFVKSYASSELCNGIVRAIEADRHAASTLLPKKVLSQGASGLTQWMVLMHRNTLDNIRNPGIYWVRLFMYIMLSFMVGTMYLHTNTDLTKEDLLPMLFYVQAFLVFMSVAVLPFFIEQRAVFVRERANQGLHVGSYVFANLLAALPGIALISILSTTLVVLLADLNGFGYFFLNLFLSLVAAESLMCVIAAAVPHYIIGIALGAGLFGMFMLCEGFMVPKHAIPDYWIWAYYMAFHTYSFESFVYTHFNPMQATDATAKAILVRYGFEKVDVNRNMGILAAYTVLFQLIFAFILYKFHTGRR
ncbi:hypothetical protein SDRG_04625 [Saprolegnia diclina VS20]|uniref:ABC transporter domain-containing protein n=1 Tax=Saprolegnia diclina (strain VS20) TaxID=1156394 RepID=T0S645_SAPDV|nr:hypothetical protein SDRG_04625 [Saprolegnia diclina VS20]EQC38197.1 hypothetical protein SDRG_04625 [Saprolegnia diclina VS20]|eukprot:XP_008608524.1 hypothetical protein SDRG_04625 [Saprolegnia diclina VS20]